MILSIDPKSFVFWRDLSLSITEISLRCLQRRGDAEYSVPPIVTFPSAMLFSFFYHFYLSVTLFTSKLVKEDKEDEEGSLPLPPGGIHLDRTSLSSPQVAPAKATWYLKIHHPLNYLDLEEGNTQTFC
jgi:hypothetical protein